MTQAEFSHLPIATQTNLLLAASLCETLRFWVPAETSAKALAQLDAVVWATARGCTRMFEAGDSDFRGVDNYERLIAAIPDDWQHPESAEPDDARDAA